VGRDVSDLSSGSIRYWLMDDGCSAKTWFLLLSVILFTFSVFFFPDFSACYTHLTFFLRAFPRKRKELHGGVSHNKRGVCMGIGQDQKMHWVEASGENLLTAGN
jgi:hypothetical protein